MNVFTGSLKYEIQKEVQMQILLPDEFEQTACMLQTFVHLSLALSFHGSLKKVKVL